VDAPTGSVDPLKYQKPAETSEASESNELITLKLRFKRPDASESELLTFPVKNAPAASPSENFRFATAVAGFGMLLRDSKHKGSASWDMVTTLAKDSVGQDPHGYRREFVSLVGRARKLAPSAVVAR
jgi:Ca-activated chloride channel family protein